jgi:hypothetical protein
MYKTRQIIIAFLLILFVGKSYSQHIENQFQTRSSIELSKKIFKKLKFDFSQEIRWNQNFKIAEYQFKSEISFKALDFLTLSANYRLIGDVKEASETEFLHKYQFKSVFKTKINRFKPGIRLSYTNYADDDENDKFLRYKGFISYDIPNCKITPKTSFEIFHQLSISSVFKYRYTAGIEYKISDKLSLQALYKFDYYKTKYKNRHIADLGLKYSF